MLFDWEFKVATLPFNQWGVITICSEFLKLLLCVPLRSSAPSVVQIASSHTSK